MHFRHVVSLILKLSTPFVKAVIRCTLRCILCNGCDGLTYLRISHLFFSTP
jgi:hypothetical protein